MSSSSTSPLYWFEAKSPVDLRLTDPDILGWLASAGIVLCLLSQCTPPPLAFCMGAGDLDSGHCTCRGSTLLTEPSFESWIVFFPNDFQEYSHLIPYEIKTAWGRGCNWKMFTSSAVSRTW